VSIVQKAVSWVKSSYEMLVLLVVILALLASALVLVLITDRERGKLSDIRDFVARSGSSAADGEQVDQTELIAMLQRSNSLAQFDSRMFVSERRVSCVACGKPIQFYAEKCPFCGAEQPGLPGDVDESHDSDMDGIPDQVEAEHGLNSNDPDDADLDADGDGFSNIEEYRAGTDMTNPEDYPPLTSKIRLLDVQRSEFQLRFNAVQEWIDGTLRFQINLRSLERTYFQQLGDVINDEKNGVFNVKVLEYLPEAPEGETLILEKDGENVRLIKNKEVTQYDLTARLAFLLDKKMFRLNVEETFDVRGKKFKVVDISRDSVLLEDVQNGKKTEITMISQAEIDSLRGRQPDRTPDAASDFMRNLPPPGAEGQFDGRGAARPRTR
jgi:hypothetical protein